MRTLYLECAMGAAGDMLMAALYELCAPAVQKAFLEEMNHLLPGVTVRTEPAVRRGLAGTRMVVEIHGCEEGHGHDHHHDHHHDHSHAHDHGQEEHLHPHDHQHRSLENILEMIRGFALPREVRERAAAVYHLIAAAEARAHGVPVGEVHFHEVGALDAVADVTGVCYLIHLLAPDAVVASHVSVGSGTVHTAHGLLPVPAPATAALLTGVPVKAGDVEGELCTPTGAALLKALADSFGPMPEGLLLGCGCGCGKKDFPRANCLRSFLLDAAGTEEGPNDQVTELKANIDDMTGEDLGFAMERLLAAGALDVSYSPLQMKKNRPGVQLICLCRPEDGDRLAWEILRQTSTLGVRRTDCARYALSADVSLPAVETAYGPVGRKAGRGYGLEKEKPEYEALAAAAREADIPLAVARDAFARSKK